MNKINECIITDNKLPLYDTSSLNELEVGNTIMLMKSQETFTIDKIFPDGYVDMTSTKEYNSEMGLNWHEKFFSIRLVNFKIIS